MLKGVQPHFGPIRRESGYEPSELWYRTRFATTIPTTFNYLTTYSPLPGQVTLKKLRLKKGALDKFRLPVDVIEGAGLYASMWKQIPTETAGHLGKFTLSLHWRNLGNQPVELLIEDVYLLVVPSPQGDSNLEEDEHRMQEAKMERLENAELLHMQNQPDHVEGP